MKKVVVALLILAIIGFVVFRDEFPLPDDSSSATRDPGVRGGAAGAGAPIAGLTRTELAFFNSGTDEFAEEEEASDGLGPTMNLGSCGGCHLQPALGGSSPPVNPQVEFAKAEGATNTVPSFITPKGPVREARFVKNAAYRGSFASSIGNVRSRGSAICRWTITSPASRMTAGSSCSNVRW